MEPVPRQRWMEFLEGLTIDGEVRVTHDGLMPSTGSTWRVRSADFDPFDHLIEVVLDDHEITVRVLLEDPRAVVYDGDPLSPSRLEIQTPSGAFEMIAFEPDG